MLYIYTNIQTSICEGGSHRDWWTPHFRHDVLVVEEEQEDDHQQHTHDDVVDTHQDEVIRVVDQQVADVVGVPCLGYGRHGIP